MNNNSCVCIAIAVIVLAILGVSAYLLITLDGNNGIVVCKVLIGVLMLLCSILLCCGISCHNKMANITEEQISGWIKKAIAKNIQVKSDENIISKLENLEHKVADRVKKINEEQTIQIENVVKPHTTALSKQIETFDNSLHQDLQKVFFTKNSNLKFLQELAHSISREGSSWTPTQIERFLQCYEVTKEALIKEMNS